ncbi:hypothetical protein [Desulfonema magnum]|uniref:Uncharacterized protein n=1 Tax=Desulfonema magnum TaxID=45655 RepID=A0A975BH62_9BACT|nr:hypothetical protein [Desulfonema magnum]QTA85432.1 Uncharacterized protein dnm_014420 [Desulfonema magnum]
MSYDITIQGNEKHSLHTDLELLKAFIAEMPNMIINGYRGFVYAESDQYWMEIDLDFVNEEGDSILCGEGSEQNKVNCIHSHIPYAFMSEEKAHKYFAVCSYIARYLQWYVYDEQSGQIID